MLHPLTMVESLDNFYQFLMQHKGFKPHEIDQMDIHHLFKLIKQEQKKIEEENGQSKNKKNEPEKVYCIDEVDGW